MSIINFLNQFPDEQKCKAHFKEYRIKQAITSKKCSSTNHKWIIAKEQFVRLNTSCRFRTTLKSGRMLEGSKLPYQYWFMAAWYIGSVKKSISALEMQRQIGYKHYEPIWFIMLKIR